nr:immunoglobulin heavy chain junction region [Macaca mulatta]MOX14532.1 immunoglobulin heavy chain junction region [Macaca mulatta]MOX15866.1 immunoglobulin heavy chain junction region [Macaca mulatta]MOX16616.1 immunoglobulin heavy chain junction region [Macaca mulatta]
CARTWGMWGYFDYW